MSRPTRIDVVYASLCAAEDSIGDARIALEQLIDAAHRVVASWEDGDLAGAVRDLAEAVGYEGAS